MTSKKIKNGRQPQKKNGRQPQKNKMEDDLKKNENGRQPQFFSFAIQPINQNQPNWM